MKTRLLPILLLTTAIPGAAQHLVDPGEHGAGAPPSVDDAPQFADVLLRTGVRLRYAVQGQPAGEPVVLLHGLTDSWFSFSRVLPMLPPSLRVYALDQRGHGESDRPLSGYTIADFAEDVVAFLDALGIREATVIGHSMGAFVAQRVAIIAPERVARLVLIDGAPSARSPALLGLRDELAPLPPRMPDEFVRAFQYGTIHAPVPNAFMERVISESAKVPTRVTRSALDGLLAAGDSAQLKGIRAPTLIVWGDRDAIFDRAAQRAYQRSIAKADLRVYADVGHTPHWESPDRFVHDVLGFLAQTSER